MKIKLGTQLICKKDNLSYLTKSKVYEIIKIKNEMFVIVNDNNTTHHFDLESLKHFFKLVKQKKDLIVKQVTDKFKARSKVGIAKYGTTLEENELSLDEWLNHAIEEQMDNILYLTKLREELKKKGIK